MKELFKLIFSLDFKGLFIEKTDNGMIKFFRYLFVGGIAFVVDYLFFTLVCFLGDNRIITILATTAGFIAGLITNFLLSKKFVFQEKANTNSVKGEFIAYTVIGVIGWFLNVLLMLLATELIGINRYIAKIVVAMIVLVYNYLARKILLYTPKK